MSYSRNNLCEQKNKSVGAIEEMNAMNKKKFNNINPKFDNNRKIILNSETQYNIKPNKNKKTKKKKEKDNNNNQNIQNDYNNVQENNTKFPIGLKNYELNCYMNSTIQCLYHIKKFRDWFNGKEISEDDNPVLYGLNIIFQKLTNDDKPFTLQKFKKIIGDIDDSFQGSNGADATDLLKTIISEINIEQLINEEEDNNDKSEQTNDSLDESNELEVFNDCKGLINKNIITKIFINYFKTTYICQNEKHKTYYFEYESILEFNLKDLKNSIISIKDCFNNYETIIEEKDNYCSKCKIHINCSSQKNIYQTSDYLIIILDYGKGKIFKGKVIFDEYINIRDYVQEDKNNQNFRLIGAVIHYGSSSASGHYISYCRSEDNKLYYFNDSSVNLTNFEKLKEEKLPYILFYEKFDDETNQCISYTKEAKICKENINNKESSHNNNSNEQNSQEQEILKKSESVISRNSKFTSCNNIDNQIIENKAELISKKDDEIDTTKINKEILQINGRKIKSKNTHRNIKKSIVKILLLFILCILFQSLSDFSRLFLFQLLGILLLRKFE